jgi:hypothetical protein
VTDTELRNAYAEALAHVGPDAGACPEPDRIRSLIQGEGPEPERMRLLDHVMRCPTCRDDFEMMRLVAGDPPHTVHARTGLTGRVRWAASVVLLAGFGAGAWALYGPDRTVTYRDEGESPILLLSPTEGGPVTSAGFVWRPVANAAEYRVEVFDDAGTALFTATTRDTILPLPDGPVLDTAVTLHWWVTARLRDGSEIASHARPFGGTGR